MIIAISTTEDKSDVRYFDARSVDIAFEKGWWPDVVSTYDTFSDFAEMAIRGGVDILARPRMGEAEAELLSEAESVYADDPESSAFLAGLVGCTPHRVHVCDLTMYLPGGGEIRWLNPYQAEWKRPRAA